MKTLNIYLLTACFWVLTACGSQQNKSKGERASVTDTREEGSNETSSKQPKKLQVLPVQNIKTPKPLVKKSQKIIKTADVRFQVKNLSKSIAKIQAMIRKYQGYVSSAKQERQYNQILSNIVIRVESDKFEDLLDETLREGIYIDHKNVIAKDVTEEFVDIQTRLKTKRAVEKRYLEILEKAKTIEEILKVENQLRVIREEIEAREGRLKFLVDQINYSTIQMVIYQKTEAAEAPSPGFLSKMGKGFKAGWQGILSFIINLTYAWPSLLVIGGGAFFGIRYWRKKIARKV